LRSRHEGPSTGPNFAHQVAADVAQSLGWSLQEAINITGDTAEYEAEGLTVQEAVWATLDAIQASA